MNKQIIAAAGMREVIKRLVFLHGAILAVSLFLAGGCSTNRDGVLRKQPPPQPQAITVDEVVPSPGPQYTWIGGHYDWRNRWVWVKGTWVKPPRPDAIWVAGRWVRNPRGWVWIRGHWEF